MLPYELQKKESYIRSSPDSGCIDHLRSQGISLLHLDRASDCIGSMIPTTLALFIAHNDRDHGSSEAKTTENTRGISQKKRPKL